MFKFLFCFKIRLRTPKKCSIYIFFYSYKKRRPLNHLYFDLLKQKIESGLLSSSKTTEDESSGPFNKENQPKKPNSIKEMQEKVRVFLLNAKIFEKALKSFAGLIENYLP